MVGFTLASSGDGLAYGAVPLLAVVVDPHPLAVSIVVAADSLPWLLLALPAGSFADRFERGPLMAVSNFIRALAILAGAILVLSDRMTLVWLVSIVLFNAGARAIYYSSLQAIVPDLVAPDSLEYANGILTGTESATEHLAGPVVGTWLFAMSRAIPFFADSVALLLSCLPFSRFRSETPRPEPSSTSPWDGARLIFSDRRLRVLLLIVGSLAGLQGMEAGVLVLLATTEWGIREGALRGLPRRRRGGEPHRKFGGRSSGPTLQQWTHPDRCSNRLRPGLPDHGPGPRLASGRTGLRTRRFRSRCRIRRRHVPPPEADTGRADGARGWGMARHRLGSRPGGCHCGRKPGRRRRAPPASGVGRDTAMRSGGHSRPASLQKPPAGIPSAE